MELIKLSNKDEFFIIDKEMIEKISVMRWAKTYWGYVEGCKDNKKYLLHRFLFDLPHGDKRVVDHKNGNRLDNRMENIRICTQGENAKNVPKQRDAEIPFKGVHKYKKSLIKPYRAQIRVNEKRVHLGYFATDIEAAIAYDKAASIYHGEFARLNFPIEKASA